MKDGGSAFPTEYLAHSGMSLRDWFAGMALIGIMLQMKAEAQLLTSLAYDIADAMLAEKEKQEKEES